MLKWITILGAGTWGTTITILLSEKLHQVTLWDIDKSLLSDIDRCRENKRYLPGISIPEGVRIEHRLEVAVQGVDCLIICLPSHGIRQVLSACNGYLPDHSLIVSCSKGMEENTGFRISQIVEDVLSGFQRGRFFVLSGPSYAREVSRKIPTAVVLAGSNGVYRESLQRLFTTSYFRVYTSCDVVGVELGGTLKNIIAIACGISDGLGYGDNTKAALISRGLVEILRLGVFLGGQRETFFGLSGLGDLVVTCMGSLSRNRLLGEKIGQGKTLEEAQSEVFMVTEGIKATKATYFLAKEHDIQMPITSEVYKVLFQGKDPLAGVSDLMLRRTKDETEDFLK